jgi:hypothetical protein
MWMTSPDKPGAPLERLPAGQKGRDGKTGADAQANLEYIRLLRILDRHPEVKRQVIESLTSGT